MLLVKNKEKEKKQFWFEVPCISPKTILKCPKISSYIYLWFLVRKDLTTGTVWCWFNEKNNHSLSLRWNVGCDQSRNFLVTLTACSDFPHQKSKSFLLQQNNHSRMHSPGFGEKRKSRGRIWYKSWSWADHHDSSTSECHGLGWPSFLGGRRGCLCQAGEVTWTHVLRLSIFL